MPPAKKTVRSGPKANASTQSSLKSFLTTSSVSSARGTQSRWEHVPQIVEAEKDLNDALDQLVARGLLDPTNRMTLDEYLDPDCERIEEDAVEPETDSDEDEEMDSDDEEIGEDTSREGAIRAARLLQRYVQHQHDLSLGEFSSVLDTFTLKLEEGLRLGGRCVGVAK